MHEIVTLQFGNQANYLGTHFWNTQESYFTYDDGENESPVNHDVLFRPGVGVDGSDTFMPRAVIYDLKGAFGSLKKVNALYELEEDDGSREILWNNGTTPIKSEPILPSAYTQALDAGTSPPPLTNDTVRYWSDYSRVYYHPRSLVQLHEFELQSQLQPFESWGVGEELFRGLDREHDLLDRDLRPFIEECDQLQGLQVLSSVDDAWGGFSARYVERLRDEFGKLSIWTWALEDDEKQQRDKQRAQLHNRALSLTALIPITSTYIPLPARPSRPHHPSYLALPPRQPTPGTPARSAPPSSKPQRCPRACAPTTPPPPPSPPWSPPSTATATAASSRPACASPRPAPSPASCAPATTPASRAASLEKRRAARRRRPALTPWRPPSPTLMIWRSSTSSWAALLATATTPRTALPASTSSAASRRCAGRGLLPLLTEMEQTRRRWPPSTPRRATAASPAPCRAPSATPRPCSSRRSTAFRGSLTCRKTTVTMQRRETEEARTGAASPSARRWRRRRSCRAACGAWRCWLAAWAASRSARRCMMGSRGWRMSMRRAGTRAIWRVMGRASEGGREGGRKSA
ncbi:tubulin domain-containing protein [Phyllosticta citribraziliensis]